MSTFSDYKLKNRLTANSFDRNMSIAQQTYQSRFNDYVQAEAMKRQQGSYEQAMDIAKQYYSSSEDPDSEMNKLMCAKAIHQKMPNLSERYIKNNIEDIMRQATGYDVTAEGLGNHIVNTFKASGYNVLASMDIASLYLTSIGASDEEFEERKQKTFDRISKYHTNYNRGTYQFEHDDLFTDMATEAASIVPSMLPTITATGVFAILNAMSGGATLPATTIGLAKAWSTLSSVQKLAGAGMVASKFGAAAIQEFGGVALDLTEMGVDKDIVFWASSAVGLLNGSLEVLGDKAEAMFAKPLNAIFDNLGPKEARRIAKKATKDVFKDYAKDLGIDMLTSIASETATEVPQELVSMLATNISLEVQKSTGKPIEDAIGYSKDDIYNALIEVAKSTAKGTAFLGFTEGAIKTSGSLVGGELRASMSSNRYTSSEGANAVIRKADTEIIGETKSFDRGKDKENKVDPVPVVKVGRKFFTVDATPEQNFAASRSKFFNAKIQDINVSKDKKIDTIEGTIQLKTLYPRIEKAYREGLIKGISYVNKDGDIVDTPLKATHVIIESRGDVPAGSIAIGDKDTVNLDYFDKFMFNEVATEEDANQQTTEEKPKAKTENNEAKPEKNNESEEPKKPEESKKPDEAIKPEKPTEPQNNEGSSGNESPVTDNAQEGETEKPEGKPSNTARYDEDSEDVTLSGETAEEENELSARIDSFIHEDEPVYNTDNSTESNVEPPEAPASDADKTTQDKPITPVEPNSDKGNTAEKPSTETKANTKNTNTQETQETQEKIAARREKEFNDSEETQSAYNDVKSHLVSDKKEQAEIDVVRDRIADVLRKIPKVNASEARVTATANATAIAAAGFARIQGISVKEFMDGIDIETVDHIKGDKHGLYFPATDKRNARIELTVGDKGTATPVTLAHEIAHGFLQTLKSDEMKAEITKAFGKKLENFNDQKFQEDFARSFEIYLQKIESKNSFLNKLFGELRDLCAKIFTTIRKQYPQEAYDLFDRMFSDEGIKIDPKVAAEVAETKSNIETKAKNEPVVTKNSQLVNKAITPEENAKLNSNPGKTDQQKVEEAVKKVEEDVKQKAETAEEVDEVVKSDEEVKEDIAEEAAQNPEVTEKDKPVENIEPVDPDEIKLDSISINKYTVKTLAKNGILTIGDVLDLQESKIKELNIPKNDMDAINGVYDRVSNREDTINDGGILIKNIKGFSSSMIKTLKKRDILYHSELLDYTKESELTELGFSEREIEVMNNLAIEAEDNVDMQVQDEIANEVKEDDVAESDDSSDFVYKPTKSINDYALKNTRKTYKPHSEEEIDAINREIALASVKDEIHGMPEDSIPSKVIEVKDLRIHKYVKEMANLPKDIDQNDLIVVMDEWGSLYIKSNIDIRTNKDGNFLEKKKEPSIYFIPVSNVLTDTRGKYSLLEAMEADMDTFKTQLKNNFELNEDTGKYEMLNESAFNTFMYDPRLVADGILYTLSDERFFASEMTQEEIIAENAEQYAKLILSEFTDAQIIKLKRGYESSVEKFEAAKNKSIDDIVEKNLAEYQKQNLTTEEMRDAATKELSTKQAMESNTLEEYLNYKLRDKLSNMSAETKGATIEKLAAMINTADNSYISVAQKLSSALKSSTEKAATERANKAIQDFIELYKKAREHMSNTTKVETALGDKYFKNSQGLYNKFLKRIKEELKSERNNTEVKKDDTIANKTDIVKFIAEIIDKDGNLKNLTNTDGQYSSYLIDIINFANTVGDKKSTSSTKYVDPEFQHFSNELLDRTNPRIIRSNDISVDEIVATIKTILKDDANQIIFDMVGRTSTINTFIDKMLTKMSELKEQIAKKSEEKSISSATYEAKVKKIEQLEANLNKMKEDKTADKQKYSELKKELDNLKADKEYKNLKNDIKKKDKEISALKQELESIRNNDPFISSLKERDARIRLDKKLRHLGDGKDARASADFNRLYSEIRALKDNPDLYKDEGRKQMAIEKNVIHPSFLEAKYDQNSVAYEILVGDLETIGIIKRDGDLIRLNKAVNDLSISDLGTFVDSVENYMIEADGEAQARREIKEAQEASLQRQIISSLRKGKITQAEARKITEAFDAERRKGSETDTKNRKGQLLHSEEFELISNIARRISPEFYAYLFGGKINGKYVENNLNSMTDNEIKNKNARFEEFSKSISDIFGIEEKKLKSKTGALFSQKKEPLKSISITNFQKNNGEFGFIFKRGRNFFAEVKNTNPKWEALTKRILNMELEVEKNERAIANLETKIERIEKSMFKTTDPDERARKEEVLENLEGKLIDRRDPKKHFTRESLNEYVMGTDSKDEYTMQQMMAIYIYAQNDSALSDILPDQKKEKITNNIPLGTVLYVIDKFENDKNYEKYRLAADKLQEIVGNRFAEFEEAHYQATGQVLKEESNYLTIKRDYSVEDYSLSHSLFGDTGVRASETMDRISAKRAVDLNIVDNFQSIISEQEHYIAFAEGMKNYSNLLSEDSAFSRTYLALEKHNGNEKGQRQLDALNDWMRLIANPYYGVSFNKAEVLHSWTMGNFVVSALAGNISAVLNSLPTYFLIARKVGWGRAFKDLGRYMTDALNKSHVLRDEVYNMSVQMKDRKRYEIARFNEMKNVQMSDFERQLNEKLGKNKDLAGDIRGIYNSTMDILLSALDKTDSAVANAMWYSAYHYNLDTLEDASVDKSKMSEEELKAYNDEYHKYCATLATQEILDMNSSHQVKDNALLYSMKSGWVKDLLMFTSQPNKQFNMILGSLKAYLADKDNKELLSQLISDSLVVMTVSAAAAFISGDFYPDKDDEDDELWFIKNVLGGTAKEMLSAFPILGKPIKELIDGYAYNDTGIAGSAINLMKVISKEPKKRTEHQLSRAWIRTISSFGEFLGLPSQMMNKMYNVYANKNLGYIVNSGTGRGIENIKEMW